MRTLISADLHFSSYSQDKIDPETILAEIGLDMERFPSDAHISRWAGVAPGNNESAGRRKTGKTTKGNKTLKSTLIQCACAASKKQGTFFYAQYQRLVVHRGKKRQKWQSHLPC
jgi:transposase